MHELLACPAQPGVAEVTVQELLASYLISAQWLIGIVCLFRGVIFMVDWMCEGFFGALDCLIKDLTL